MGDEKHEAFFTDYQDGVKKGHDTTIDITSEKCDQLDFSFNNTVIHGKGWAMICALREALGKEVFEKIYHNCLLKFGGKRLTYRQFQEKCEEISGENLNWFFSQWVRSNKFCAFQVGGMQSIYQNNQYTTIVRIDNHGDLNQKVAVRATFKDGSRQVKHLNRPLRTQYLSFEGKTEVDSIEIDPHHMIAMIDTTISISSVECKEMQAVLPYDRDAREDLALYNRVKSHEINIDENEFWYKLGLKLFYGNALDESYEAFEHALLNNPSKHRTFLLLVWQGHTHDLRVDRQAAISKYGEALEYDDGSTAIYGDMNNLIINRKWVEDRLQTPFQTGLISE